MKHRVWILALFILVALAALARAQARMDDASLKVAHEALIGGVKTANFTMLQAMMHPRGIGFFRESLGPVELRADGAADFLPAVVADLGRFITVPTTTIYRVVEQVGVVVMTAQLTSQVQAQKGSKLPERFSRATYVYVVVGGNWKLLSWHGSDTPVPTPKK